MVSTAIGWGDNGWVPVIGVPMAVVPMQKWNVTLLHSELMVNMEVAVAVMIMVGPTVGTKSEWGINGCGPTGCIANCCGFIGYGYCNWFG